MHSPETVKHPTTAVTYSGDLVKLSTNHSLFGLSLLGYHLDIKTENILLHSADMLVFPHSVFTSWYRTFICRLIFKIAFILPASTYVF